MEQTQKLPKPKTEAQFAAAKEGLEWLLTQFDSKNDMSRTTGIARNTVSWWYTKGYVASPSAIKIAKLLNEPVEKIRPDILIKDE